MTISNLMSVLLLAALTTQMVGCAKKTFETKNNPAPVSLEEPSSQDLFEAYLESVRVVKQKKAKKDKIEEQFEKLYQKILLAKVKYRASELRLHKLAREAARAEDGKEAYIQVQNTKQEFDEFLSEYKALIKEEGALGPSGWPQADYLQSVHNMQEALKRLDNKLALENKTLSSAIPSIRAFQLRRTLQLSFITEERAKGGPKELKAALEDCVNKLNTLKKAELDYEEARNKVAANSGYRELQERFVDTIMKLPDSKSKIDANLVSELQELGRKLDLIEEDYNKSRRLLEQKYSELTRAQAEYSDAFRFMVEQTSP